MPWSGRANGATRVASFGRHAEGPSECRVLEWQKKDGSATKIARLLYSSHAKVFGFEKVFDHLFSGFPAGVVEDDERRVPAEFERKLLHGSGALLHLELAVINRARSSWADR